MTIRTRFAPSPTGYLHIGGVRTALFNYLLAKKPGGQFLLRIDDTDQQRNVQEALQPILEGFRWLGLNWDEGPDVGGPHAPYYQSQRMERYRAEVMRLLEAGHAYRDYARPEELQEQREAAEKEGRPFLYDRKWMARDESHARQLEAEGRTAAVRLKMPREGQCTFHDVVRGDVAFDWAQEQDHVVQRADGTCLYHLASVVDDYDFRITHVVRAVEHLPNTPRQIFIAQSLGYPLPVYAHLPYVAEPGGSAKMSKRKLDKYLKQKDFASLYQHGEQIAQKMGWKISPATFNPVVVDFYRSIGFLPEAILNYLLLLGWSLDDSTESFTLEEAIKAFSLERVQKSPASFDCQKLVAFQSRWMQRISAERRREMVWGYLSHLGWMPPLESASPSQIAQIDRLLEVAGDRIKMGGDILQLDEFFQTENRLAIDKEAWEKRYRNDPTAQKLLADYHRFLIDQTGSWKADSLEASTKQWLEQQGAKFGQLVHALRLAVTGKSSGVGMFEAMELLGAETSLRRIEQAISGSEQA
jgi:glutamyl-tRNA synthetase